MEAATDGDSGIAATLETDRDSGIETASESRALADDADSPPRSVTVALITDDPDHFGDCGTPAEAPMRSRLGLKPTELTTEAEVTKLAEPRSKAELVSVSVKTSAADTARTKLGPKSVGRKSVVSPRTSVGLKPVDFRTAAETPKFAEARWTAEFVSVPVKPSSEDASGIELAPKAVG